MPGISDEALGPPHATAGRDSGTTSSAVPAHLRHCWLGAWAQSWSQVLGRDVSHAVLDGTGPLDTSGIGSGISVHFRETDWILHSPGGR
jgi:hypothetical protein